MLRPLLLLALVGPALGTDISGPLSDDTTGPLTPGVYRLVNDVSVPAGKTLTIHPGVIIKAEDSHAFDVSGTLDAQGTTTLPIVFTGIEDDSVGGDTNSDGPSDAVPGSWRGVRLWQDADASVLRNVEVRFAGYAGWPGLQLSFADCLVEDCTFRDNLHDGMTLASNTVGATVTGCHFEANGEFAIGHTPLRGVAGFANNTATGNGFDTVEVSSYGAVGDATLTGAGMLEGALYLTFQPSVPVGTTLTLEAGVVLKFDGGDRLNVNGTLVTLGTPTNPVVMTSHADDDHGGDTNGDGPSSGTPGDWRGCYLWSTASASSLTGLVVRYAGTAGWGGVTLDDCPATLSGCTLRDNAYDGLNLDISTIGASVVGCHFENNGHHAVGSARLGAVPGFLGNTASGNGLGDGIEVTDGILTADATITAANVLNGALYVDDNLEVLSGLTLTLEPGLVIKLGLGHRVTLTGTLVAGSSLADPVVFTSYLDDEFGGDTDLGGPAPQAGDWYTLEISSIADPSTLRGVRVRYAGASGWASIWCRTGAATVSHCRAEHGSGPGFRFDDHAGDPAHLIAYDVTRGVDCLGGLFDLRRVTVLDASSQGIRSAIGHSGGVVDSIVWNATLEAFDGFAPGAVRYSNGDPLRAGSDGNIHLDPQFVAPGVGDVRLTEFSPCANAGDPNSALDPDGTRADMGAEIFDHCVPRVVCDPLKDSLGCIPTIGAVGSPSLTGADDFHLLATDLQADTTAVVLWGLPPVIKPPGFGGPNVVGATLRGTRLCLRRPEKVDVLGTGGTPGTCEGALDLHLTQAWMNAAGLLPGQTIHLQVLYVDPGATYQLGHSAALRFQLCP